MVLSSRRAWLPIVLLTLVAIWSGSSPAAAKCVSGYVDVWPEAGSIPPNAVFLLETYGMDRTWASALETCDLKLTADTDEVCLVEVLRSDGGYRIQQLLLKPERALIKGLTYTLSLPTSVGEEKADLMLSGLPESFSVKQRTWIVDLSADHLAPQWREPPRVKNTELKHYGCGRAIRAWVEASALEENPVLAKVTLWEAGSAETRQSMLPIAGDYPLEIGHGMCSGAFDLKPNKPYEVRLELMDVAGNTSESAPHHLMFQVEERRFR